MDEQLLLLINQGWSHPYSDAFFFWVSQRVTFALPMMLIILTLLWRSHGRDGIKLWGMLLLLIIVGDQIGNLLKDIFAQPRPCAVLFEVLNQPYKTQGVSCGAMTTGMPSSHALNFFLTAAFLGTVLKSWRWATPLLLIALIVGLSRIYLAAHFPSQVLAGTSLGVIIGILTALAGVKYLPFIKNIRNKQEQQHHE